MAGLEALNGLKGTVSYQHLVAEALPTLPVETVNFLAIDPPNPHEIDDAVQVRRKEDGGFAIRVAVADGSLVPNELVDGAILRKRTRYAREGAVPMLPFELSVDTLSFSDLQRRPALVVDMTMQAEGALALDGIARRAITARQMTYGDMNVRVRQIDPSGKHWAIVAAVARFREAAGYSPLQPGASKFCHRLVAHMMIAANMSMAQWMTNSERPFLYRNFSNTAARLDDMVEEEVGEHHGRAHYSTTPLGHDNMGGLYAQVTTPLARAADLLNHRQVRAILDGEKPPYSQAQLDHYAGVINDRSRAA